MIKCCIPFPKGVKYKAVQPTGKYAHSNWVESKYAIDFIVPVGTPVIAVKKGVVIMAKGNSKKHGLDASIDDTNLVAIDHRDGTFTEYLHLGYNKVFVKEGQEVEQGDVIAQTGLSGIMSEPHLHFNAFKVEGRKGISIPVEFEEG